MHSSLEYAEAAHNLTASDAVAKISCQFHPVRVIQIPSPLRTMYFDIAEGRHAYNYYLARFKRVYYSRSKFRRSLFIYFYYFFSQSRTGQGLLR